MVSTNEALRKGHFGAMFGSNCWRTVDHVTIAAHKHIAGFFATVLEPRRDFPLSGREIHKLET